MYVAGVGALHNIVFFQARAPCLVVCTAKALGGGGEDVREEARALRLLLFVMCAYIRSRVDGWRVSYPKITLALKTRGINVLVSDS